MASTRRTARTLLAGACVVPLLAFPGVASAAPPDHAAANGQQQGKQSQQQGKQAAEGRAQERPATGAKGSGATASSARPDRPGANGAGRGGPPTRDTGADRTTSAASTTTSSSSDSSTSSSRGGSTTGPSADTGSKDDRPGRGRGRLVPPGHATDGDGGREAAGGATTPSAPTTDPSSPPAGPAAGPAPSSPASSGPAGAPTATPSPPALVPPPSFAVTTPAPPAPAEAPPPAAPAEAPAVPGPALTLDQRLEALLDDVGSIGRGVPGALGPVPEPLSDLVPTLLLILGAFLVVQRGIGRGLGHVPMAGGARPGQSPRS